MATSRTRRTRVETDDDVVDSSTPAPAPAAISHLAPGGRLVSFADVEDEESEDPSEVLASQMRAVLDGSQGEATRAALYRKNNFSRKLEWCSDYTPEQVLDGSIQSLIASQFGPGDYEVRIINRTGVRGRYNFAIAERNRANEAAAPTAAAPAADSMMLRVLESIAEGQRVITQALTQRPDPQQQMRDTLSLMAMFREAMGVTATPAAAAVQPADSLQQIERTLAVITKLRDASSELAPKDQGDSDNPLSLAMKGLDVLQTFAQRGALPAPVGAVPGAVQPIALPPSAASNAEPEEASDSQDFDAMRVQGILIAIKTGASSNRNPAEMAEYLYQVAPDEWMPMLKLPNWFDFMKQIAPELEPHQAWMTSVRDELIKLTESDQA